MPISTRALIASCALVVASLSVILLILLAGMAEQELVSRGFLDGYVVQSSIPAWSRHVDELPIIVETALRGYGLSADEAHLVTPFVIASGFLLTVYWPAFILVTAYFDGLLGLLVMMICAGALGVTSTAVIMTGGSVPITTGLLALFVGMFATGLHFGLTIVRYAYRVR